MLELSLSAIVEERYTFNLIEKIVFVSDKATCAVAFVIIVACIFKSRHCIKSDERAVTC